MSPDPAPPTAWISEGTDEDPLCPAILYDGPMTLHSGAETAEGEGQVHLRWRPQPEITYSFRTEAMVGTWIMENDPPPTLSVPVGNPPMPRFDPSAGPARETRSHDTKTSVVSERIQLGDPSMLDLLVVQIINFPFSVKPYAPRPWSWPVAGWDVELMPIKEMVDWVKDTGGYAPTHSLIFERADRTPFDASETDEIRAAFWFVLSMAAGGNVGHVMPMGYRRTELVWTEWSATIVDQWTPTLTWFDPTLMPELGSLAEAWLRKTDDRFWNSVLPRAVRQHVAAYRADTTEVRVVLALIELDLLSWAVLVIDKERLPVDQELPTAAMLRLLLEWAGISPDVPDSLPHLHALGQKDPNLVDGPAQLAWIRNRNVHPPKNAVDGEAAWPPPDVTLEAWLLVLEYADLVLLRLLDYEGRFGSHLHRSGRFVGQLSPVPWIDGDLVL